MDRPNSEMFPTKRIAFRVEGVPIPGPQGEPWRKALKAAAIEARAFSPWVGVGPLACYIRLVTPRPVVKIDLAAGAGHGTDPGNAGWNTKHKPAWVFRAVLPSLGPKVDKGGKTTPGILWDDIRQVCFPMADVRVRAVDDEPHTVVVVTELPPIECGIMIDIRGLMTEADSWSARGQGLRGREAKHRAKKS